MRTIYSPTNTPRTAAACANAMEPAFAQLLDRAELAGWSRNEALRALCVLTWRFVEQGNEQTEPVGDLAALSGAA